MIDGEMSRRKTGKYRPAIGLRDTTTYIIIKKKESSYFTQEEAIWDVRVGRDGLLSPPYEYFRDHFYKPPTFQVLATMREKIFYTLARCVRTKMMKCMARFVMLYEHIAPHLGIWMYGWKVSFLYNLKRKGG
jgi:hypothetical protein